jgi:hypothetical protein
MDEHEWLADLIEPLRLVSALIIDITYFRWPLPLR